MSEAIKTALFDNHEKHGGRIVDFAGWALPVQYDSIIKEHQAVRESAGVFDCSHMGQFFVSGPDASKFVNYMISNNLDKIEAGRGLYTGLLYENGTFVDDIIVYKKAEDNIFMVVNAANVDKDFAWFSEKLKEGSFDAKIVNRSDEYSLLAVQGPQAPEKLDQLFPGLYGQLKTFGHCEIEYSGQTGLMCRTGYTGEAGVELIIKNAAAGELFDALIEIGVKACGLGSRDSLRLEKGFSLYGHEINDQTNALEAGLGWVCDLNKDDFIGKLALEEIKAAGTTRKLVGFKATVRPIPRDGDKLLDSVGKEIGFVTSGTMSKALDCGIGLAYICKNYSADKVQVQTRRKLMEVELCGRSFV
ncbi:glycine cleavage system aminomethyltransferase GcvT [Lentisphaera marina]|uniref:glycine cleavage system aminomethyltransferase GcvT n=1 Tax=Lentisphaera marina TaxID=1111041 RepID=UPI0023659CA0|nr:glycine cleavage system aminomethyltransferase GcvT [Lentisphaera marina]MDD7984927.1 glycine cleavage system aminomethyltransferase GcvT [Lentisphaera marina]